MKRSRGLLLLLVLVFLGGAMSLNTMADDTHAYEKPEDVVAWVYRDFAFTVVMSTYWENASLVDQSKETLLLYFTDELASLIIKDRQCMEETNMICNLDFNPIFASQDPGATDLKVAPADESNTVRVQFRYPGGGKTIRVSYEVEKTRRGWRIKDIIYSGSHSLRKILSQ